MNLELYNMIFKRKSFHKFPNSQPWIVDDKDEEKILIARYNLKRG